LFVESWFKSYYVVWKLAKKQKDFSTLKKFKSYYVVWKRMQMTHNKKSTHGLNRTM